MKLVNIGFGNVVALDRLVAIVSQDSAPIKRMILDSRNRGELVDASFGRKTQSVLIMDSGHVILSALAPEKISQRISGAEKGESEHEG